MGWWTLLQAQSKYTDYFRFKNAIKIKTLLFPRFSTTAVPRIVWVDDATLAVPYQNKQLMIAIKLAPSTNKHNVTGD